MNGWFIALVVLWSISVGVALNTCNEQKTDEAVADFVIKLISVAVEVVLVTMAIKKGF